MARWSLPCSMQEAKHIEYADSRYANQNPCTTVYRLVCQLLGRDEKLNVELIAKIECE